jgi:hypothetical protein
LWNRGNGVSPQFVPLTTTQTGDDFFQPLAARGAAYADVDLDGDTDLLITQIADTPRLFRNDQQTRHHWLRLKLIGDPAQHVNRDAIGAWVELDLGQERLRRQVMPTRSYLSQVELPITIGLGTHDHVDRLTILWPNGARQTVNDIKVNGLNTIRFTTEKPKHRENSQPTNEPDKK